MELIGRSLWYSYGNLFITASGLSCLSPKVITRFSYWMKLALAIGFTRKESIFDEEALYVEARAATGVLFSTP